MTQLMVVPTMPRLTDSLAKLRRECDSWVRREAWRSEVRADDNESARLEDYPVGYCSVIRDRVYEGMLRLPQIQQMISSEIVLKKIFVILKGLYFQNAIQLGNIYIDVANDTVDPSKSWLEWMHVSKVDYTNLGELDVMIRVAERYHRCRVYPNLFFPLLTPVVPLLAVRESGGLELLHFQDGGFLKDLSSRFFNLKAWLAAPVHRMKPLPDQYIRSLAEAVGSNDFARFPFEFRPCSVEEVGTQADAYADAYAETSTHGTVLAVLKLVYPAVQQLRCLKIGIVPA